MKKLDEEEVWSAIRYLDPDEKRKHKKPDIATIAALLALPLIVGGVWFLFWLRIG